MKTKILKDLQTLLEERWHEGKREVLLENWPAARAPDVHERSAEKKEDLESLSEKVTQCRRCPLGSHRLKAVFGMGNPRARVMFVGEGPGFEEDHKGLPFIGKAGELLDKILAAMNLAREKVYITNIVKCHPMANPQTPEARGNDRKPTPQEIEACLSYLKKQIALIAPEIVVALGNTAAQTLLNSTESISRLRGKTYPVENSVLIPTYHPAALLRNPSLKKAVWEDMKIAMGLLG